MRTFFIWVFGLFGTGFMGGMIGYALERRPGDNNTMLGLLGGMMVFACLRLWLAAPKPQPTE